MENYLKIIIFFTFILSSAFYSQNKYESFKDIEKVIENAIDDKTFPGAVVLVWQDRKILFEKGFGHYTYDSKSPKVSTETIFDLASVTKVVATTTAAMICYDRKLFSLDDKVVKYIPEFGVNGKENITISNLLLHNSGLVAWKKFYERNLTADEVLKEIYAAELEYKTGEKMVYSDLGIIESNLSVVDSIKGLFDEALIYFKRALINYEKVSDKKRMAEIHQNIGMV